MISTATANPVLTGIFAKFMMNQRELVARKLFPFFYSGLQSAQYYVFDKANYFKIPGSLRRAPAGDYTRSRMTLSDDSYACVEYGHEEPIDDRERKKYAIAFDADAAAVRRLGWIHAIAYEQRVQAKAAALAGVNPVALWDDYQTSNPMNDVDAIRESIHNNIGVDPNLMILPRPVYFKLKEHPKILDKIKYTQKGVLTPELLASVFGVEELVVAGGIANTANEGQALTIANIWGKDVYLAYVDASQDFQALSYGRTFAWTGEVGADGALVESYRDDEARSDIHRARMDVDEKVTATEAAAKLAAVIA